MISSTGQPEPCANQVEPVPDVAHFLEGNGQMQPFAPPFDVAQLWHNHQLFQHQQCFLQLQRLQQTGNLQQHHCKCHASLVCQQPWITPFCLPPPLQQQFPIFPTQLPVSHARSPAPQMLQVDNVQDDLISAPICSPVSMHSHPPPPKRFHLSHEGSSAFRKTQVKTGQSPSKRSSKRHHKRKKTSQRSKVPTFVNLCELPAAMSIDSVTLPVRCHRLKGDLSWLAEWAYSVSEANYQNSDEDPGENNHDIATMMAV